MQNLAIGIVSYDGELKVTIKAEKDFIDTHKLEVIHRECNSTDAWLTMKFQNSIDSTIISQSWTQII